MALDRPTHEKKLCTQEQFEKLLLKRCPFHLDGKHSAKECCNLQKAVNNFIPEEKGKKKKDGEEDEDKEDVEKTTGYQDKNRTMNVIFGGEGCLSK